MNPDDIIMPGCRMSYVGPDADTPRRGHRDPVRYNHDRRMTPYRRYVVLASKLRDYVLPTTVFSSMQVAR